MIRWPFFALSVLIMLLGIGCTALNDTADKADLSKETAGPDQAAPENCTAPELEWIEPEPTEPVKETLQRSDLDRLAVVYEKNGALKLVVGREAPQPLTEGTDDSYPLLSPDGSKVLFRRYLHLGPSELPRFELWMVNLDGTNVRPLVTLDHLPGTMGKPMGSEITVLLDRLPWHVRWKENSKEIVFNTLIESGYGLSTNNDLWLADVLSGAVTQILPDGLGGSFAFSPDGSALIVADDRSVSIMDAGGDSRSELISFPFVNTASEYAFIPQPAWAPDGSYGLVAISGPEPFGDNEERFTSIWMLPRGGDAVELFKVYGWNLDAAMSGNIFSPDCEYIAFAIGDSPDGSFNISAPDGSIIATFDYARVNHGWSADSRLLILEGEEPFLAGIDRPKQVLQLPAGVDARATWYRWISSTVYIGLEWNYNGTNQLFVTEVNGEVLIIDSEVGSFDALIVQ